MYMTNLVKRLVNALEEIPKPDSSQKLRVGITYNLKKNIATDVEDFEAEFDSIETVHAIRDALEAGGYETQLLEATEELPAALQKQKA
jgi:D-alanine-D-alanine ligase